MEDSICRFCLTRCLNFKNVERTHYGTLNMLLPSLNLEVSRDPVVCKSCSEIMKKYLTFKTMSLDIRNVPDIRDVCLFCKSSITLITFFFLNSQDTDIYLLRTMMNQYFPELDLQANADIFIICSVCRRSIQKIFDFLANWQNVEQHIEKYCQSVGVFGKGDIDLKSVMYYREPTVESKDDSNSHSIVQLAADQFIKQEPSEEDSDRYITEENEKIFLPVTEVKENVNFVDVNVKLEVENDDLISPVCYKPTETLSEDIDSADRKVKLEVENSNLSSLDCKPTEISNEENSLVDPKIKLEVENENIIHTVVYKPTEIVDKNDSTVNPNVKLEEETENIKNKVSCKPSESSNKKYDLVGPKVANELKYENIVSTVGYSSTGSSKRNVVVDPMIKLEVECEDTIKATGYKPREVLNENSVLLDQKHNLEPEAEVEEAFSDTHGGRIKVEQVWLEQEDIDIKSTNDDIDHLQESVSEEEIKFPSTGDSLGDSIDRVVRRWANYEPIKDQSKPTEDPKEEEKAPKVNRKKSNIVAKPLSEDVKAKMLLKRRWWSNTAVVNRPSTQYFTKTELRAMISRIQVSGEKKYQCQVCQFVARAKCSMNRHMKLHQDPSELETFHCHNCNYKTYRKGDLANHISTHRDPSQKPIYQCQHCSFSAKMRDTLRRHLVIHDAITDVAMFECYDCGFKVDRKPALEKHIAAHRRPKVKPQKVYSCDRCSYKVNVKSRLDRHKLMHLQPKETTMYQCESCSYETKYKSVFSRHLEMHRQPVECVHCDFKTKYTATLRRHLLRTHKVVAGWQKCDVLMMETE